MTDDYIILKDKTYTQDKNGLHEQPTHPQMDKILKLENSIEILEATLQAKESELASTKRNKKTLKITALLFTFVIGIILPIVLAAVSYCSTEYLEPAREYFGIHWTFWNELFVAGALCTPFGFLAGLTNVILVFDRKRKIKRLSAVVEYLKSKVHSAKLSFEKIKQNTQKSDSLVEGEILHLKDHQMEYNRTLNREIEIAETLGTSDSPLSELQPILEKDGFTTEEIAEVAKHLSFNLKNSL